MGDPIDCQLQVSTGGLQEDTTLRDYRTQKQDEASSSQERLEHYFETCRATIPSNLSTAQTLLSLSTPASCVTACFVFAKFVSIYQFVPHLSRCDQKGLAVQSGLPCKAGNSSMLGWGRTTHEHVHFRINYCTAHTGKRSARDVQVRLVHRASGGHRHRLYTCVRMIRLLADTVANRSCRNDAASCWSSSYDKLSAVSHLLGG